MTISEDSPAAARWLLPIPDAHAALGIGRTMLYELAGSGEIEIVRIGRRALVPAASIEAYVGRLRAADHDSPRSAA